MPPIVIAAGIAAAGGIAGGAISASASGSAAKTQSNAALQAAQVQADAAKYGADLQAKAAANALAFTKQTWDTTQANLAPWLEAGKTALNQLSTGTAPGGEFTKGFTTPFTAPTLSESTDPGLAARFQLGMQALQRAGAAQGRGLGGAALKEATRYGQDYASNEYSNVYQRALQQYQTAFNVYNTNQANAYNRLAAISGTGQVTAQQLGQTGSSTADQVANITIGSAEQQAQAAYQEALATGSGYIGSANALAAGRVGSANAWNNALGNTSNAFLQAYLMSQMKNQNNNWYPYIPTPPTWDPNSPDITAGYPAYGGL